jgi:hypothetical protein
MKKRCISYRNIPPSKSRLLPLLEKKRREKALSSIPCSISVAQKAIKYLLDDTVRYSNGTGSRERHLSMDHTIQHEFQAENLSNIVQRNHLLIA